ncbi:MAG: DUF6056 family protein [Eubacterium sp.]|nr:DUF6056 family protein [Eubacterium sp.]
MEKTEKVTARILLCIMIISLLPIIYLGRYNHPTGDDYYYGADTRAVWEETGNIVKTMAEAVRGTARQYQVWQGTYSALFLMHLSPNIFHEAAYGFVTFGILLLFSGGIFYLLKPVVCTLMKGSAALWLMVSSLLTFLCVQTVDFQGESFFWYNGSMYYTGYYAVTCIFFGLMIKYLTEPRKYRFVGLLFLALFLAGGNYVSLLPAMIILLLSILYLFWTHSERAKAMTGVFVLMLAGFFVSAAAPGNEVRQDGMWQIPAWKAVAKSLFQGLYFIAVWADVWLILALLILTPFLWRSFARTKFRFRYPLLAVGVAYGIYCSMCCPGFYTMNAPGPARAGAIIYYGYLLFIFAGYGYLLGYLYRLSEKRQKPLKSDKIAKGAAAVFLILMGVQIFTGALGETTTGKAVRLLKSGEAAAYEQEYQARLRILEDDTVQDVVFQAYENQPDMLYVGDFSMDAQDETNRKLAQYFHKRTVYVNY